MGSFMDLSSGCVTIICNDIWKLEMVVCMNYGGLMFMYPYIGLRTETQAVARAT